MDRDMNAGLDALQADMAAHQQRTGREVTAEKNRHLAADAFQRLDKELVERPVDTAPVAPSAIEAKSERREVAGRGYVLSAAPEDDVLTRRASPAETWFLEHAMPRVELLLSKPETGPLGQPSWRQRMMAVLDLKTQSIALKQAGHHELAAMNDKRYMFDLVELLEASSASFGDWKQDAPKKLVVSG